MSFYIFPLSASVTQHDPDGRRGFPAKWNGPWEFVKPLSNLHTRHLNTSKSLHPESLLLVFFWIMHQLKEESADK